MADFRITAAEDIRAFTRREDRQFQIVRADAEAFDMVVVLMGDENAETRYNSSPAAIELPAGKQ